MKYINTAFITMVIVSCIVFFMLLNAFNRGIVIYSIYPKLDDAIMNVMIHTSQAHLILEEVVSGDKAENIDDVYLKIDKSLESTLFLLDEKFSFIFADESKERENILELKRDIEKFKNLTILRNKNHIKHATGSQTDVEYDKIFDQILQLSESIEQYIHRTRDNVLIEFEQYKKFTLTLFLLLIISGLYFLFRSNKELAKMSVTDSLTKLYNRDKLDDVLISESRRSNRYGHSFGIIFIDIDFFKNINDTFGHQSGDSLLVEFSRLLRNNSRNTDIVGRWGGEEFLVICTETDIKGILTLAEFLREIISNHPFNIGEQQTASFGISVYVKGENIQQTIKRADEALYRAKKNGRNRVEGSEVNK